MSDEGIRLLVHMAEAAELRAKLQVAHIDLSKAFFVGGVVRDAMLAQRDKLPPLAQQSAVDIDIAVEGDGIEFAEQIAAVINGEIVAKSEFGTATVAAKVGLSEDRVLRVDVASCRTETYPEPGALPKVTLEASIEDDLVRRDFSVNAIALRMEDLEVIDPLQGRDAIVEHRLSLLHDRSIKDDPTRIFRAARYASRLGLSVDSESEAIIMDAISSKDVVNNALSTISADRLKNELELILRERSSPALTLLENWGVLETLEPRLNGSLSTPPVMESIDAACGIDPARNAAAWEMRLAALLRPLGEDVAGWLTWIDARGSTIQKVLDYLRVLNPIVDEPSELSVESPSQLYRRFGEVEDEVFALAFLIASVEGHSELVAALERFRHALRGPALMLRGDDIVNLGAEHGPAVGEILGELFLRQLDGEFSGSDEERRQQEEEVAKTIILHRKAINPDSDS